MNAGEDAHAMKSILRRDFTDSEGAEYQTPEELPSEVEAVAAILARHDLILAVTYLFDRVPNSRAST